ncbi:hypothetical protein PIB30_073885 [Stylosanthes scabra]|uniref:Uncharacterized protein n=1 Tax=Stylosanthes scabra TaxID=79078 RepID=A0ABU6YQW0_9FABA|nr:hypothetical protein [Stylosanthes scabra]
MEGSVGYGFLEIECLERNWKFLTGKNSKVFRVDRIDSGTPRIDSYPSRDEISLPGLQGIDSQPSGIDSATPYLNTNVIYKRVKWLPLSGRHHRSDVYVSRSDSGGLRADIPAYDNSGLSSVVHDRGVFGLTSRCSGQ